MKIAQELRAGNVIMHGKDPMIVLKTEYSRGGRGAATVRLKLKALFGYGASANTVLQEDPRSRLDYLLAIPTTALERPDGVWMVLCGALALLAVLLPNRALRWTSAAFAWVLGLNLVADRNFAAGTLYVARGAAIEFYEQVRGLMSVEAPGTLGRTFSYYGYVATFIADADQVKYIVVN